MMAQDEVEKREKRQKARKTADKSIFRWNYPRLCDKMAVCEEAGRRYRDTCLLLCEKGEKREHMKKFYAWYQKHITGAIFTGLILGILTGLLLADRFTPILTVTGVIGGITGGTGILLSVGASAIGSVLIPGITWLFLRKDLPNMR